MIAITPTTIMHLVFVLLRRATVVTLLAGVGLAHADYRQTVPVLRIGITEPHLSVTDPDKLETIGSAFSEALGIPVKIIRMHSYAALVDAQASGNIGYAVHSARSFAATDAVCGCVKPLRTPVADDGSTGFRSVLVVRDKLVKPVSQLKIAYSNEKSVSGWQIPHQAIKIGSLEQPQLIRAGSVGSVIALYVSGEIDGFFGWLPDSPGTAQADDEQLFGGWRREKLKTSDPVRLVWSSQRIPYGPHVVHRSLPDDLVAALGAFLDRMPDSAPGLLDIFEPVFGGGYAVPEAMDYESLRGLVLLDAPE